MDTNWPGSKWWKFDFHNHTPESSDYDVTERSSLQPKDWLLAYMTKGVDCVVVTDHNSGGWIQSLQTELTQLRNDKPNGYRELELFPGIEFTAQEGIHVLGIFPQQQGYEKVVAAKAAAKCNDHGNNAESICDQGAVEICKTIHLNGGLAIAAHIENKCGVLEGSLDPVTGEFNAKHGDRTVDLIIQASDAVEVHDMTSPAIVKYADKLNDVAQVDGSDAHKTADAGTRYVWLKMSTPNIEGIRLALCDPESSLLRMNETNNPNVAPGKRIESLTITDLYLRRESPLKINFSPWFNAVIGGRGSGKSTIVESLRLALARENEILDLDEKESDVKRSFERFNKVNTGRGQVGMLLESTGIKAEVVKDGGDSYSRYKYESGNDGHAVYNEDDQGQWDETGLDRSQAKNNFPVKIFSQKQVFELSDRPRALLAYIDDAVADVFQDWSEKFSELKDELIDLRSEERRLKSAVADRSVLEVDLKENKRKLKVIENSNMKDKVNSLRKNQAALKRLDDFLAAIDQIQKGLKELLFDANPFDVLELDPVDQEEVDSSVITQLALTLKSELEGIYRKVEESLAEIGKKREQFSSNDDVIRYRDELRTKVTALSKEFEEIKEQGITSLSDTETLLVEQQRIIDDLAKVDDAEEQLSKLQNEILKAYARLSIQRRKLTKIRQQFVDDVLTENDRLKITIQGQLDIAASEEEFRRVLRLKSDVFKDDVDGILNTATENLGVIPAHRKFSVIKVDILERNKDVLGVEIHGKLLKSIESLSPQDDDELLSWFPDDKVSVEYRRNSSDKFHSLETASAGQKTSAILSFILHHGDEPLIMDQPEDDLDNSLITSLVVNQLRTNKKRRQIIVVTHNPNIVVNGDAELVLPMEFQKGQIHLVSEGGLQEVRVRERICEVMEGGRDAFEQRYKRILKDLN